jgi:membrane-associated phospholipid phosphatase
VTGGAWVLRASVLVFLPAAVGAKELPDANADAGATETGVVLGAQAASVPPGTEDVDALAARVEAAAVGPLDVWPRYKPRTGPWDLVAVSTLGLSTVLLQVTYTPATVPNWTGGILFDDWFRRVFRLSSDSARAATATTSDVLLYAMAALPFVDAWLGAALTYGRPDVALKLTVLDAEALLATTFVTLGAQHLTLRARPFVTLCAHEPNARECTDGSAQDTSFPSGHTAIAFTSALLECVNHAHLDINRDGWNGAACPVSLVAAGITGILRIASDRHYASDVIVGGLIGAGIGYLVPTLHFAVVSKDSSTMVVPMMAPGYAGLALSGDF